MLAYYLAARTGMALFSLQPGNITLLWLASGIGMVMCMHLGTIAFPMIVLTSFLANYPGMAQANASAPVLHTLISALADGLVGVLAMLMMRRFLRNGLNQASDLLPFGALVCLLPTVLSSLIISTNLALDAVIRWDEVLALMRMLTVADSLGILLMYPLYQAWQAMPAPSMREWQWMCGVLLSTVLVLLLAFGGNPGFVYFILPSLLMLAFQVRLNGVTTVLTMSMITIIAATGQHLGPFQSDNPTEANFMLVSFVYTTTFVILGISLRNQQLIASDASRQIWQEVAQHDPLTGLLNRLVFLPMLQVEHQRARRTGRPYALAMLDIDHFKKVNDVHGHPAGDVVLLRVAMLMQANVRDIDKTARIGGEEFAILFPEATAAEAAVAMDRLRKELEANPVQTPHASIPVTISIGIAEYCGSDDTPDAIREQADQLLYAAKNAGRNRLVCSEFTLSSCDLRQ